jgi:hypothetical protein
LPIFFNFEGQVTRECLFTRHVYLLPKEPSIGTIGNIKTSLFTCVVLQYFMQIGGITPLGFYSDALTGQKMQVHLLTAPGVLFIWVVTH